MIGSKTPRIFICFFAFVFSVGCTQTNSQTDTESAKKFETVECSVLGDKTYTSPENVRSVSISDGSFVMYTGGGGVYIYRQMPGEQCFVG